MKSKKLQGALQKFNQKSSDVELISESEELQVVGGLRDAFLAKDCTTWSGTCGTWGGSCGTWGDAQ